MQERVWILRAYDKNTDEAVSEVPLNGMDLHMLKLLFNEPADPFMYDSYPVTIDHLHVLQRYTDDYIDLGKYDYLVEYH
jgi:hypothetical protein